MNYYGPGKYVAICNKTNWDGHYVKHFEVPSELSQLTKDSYGIEDVNKVSASWYFLNVIDLHACVEAIYPADLFVPK